MLADLGRPRSARMGTMDFSCFGVSGRASGSALAAAVMALSSCEVGITTEGRLDILDMGFRFVRCILGWIKLDTHALL